MDYQRIYNQIIERAINRELHCYKEKHHIIPKCIGGTNDKLNLVNLTAREHFICHWLLVRIFPDNHKIIYAFWAMCNQKSEHQIERRTPSSRVYEEGRNAFSKIRKGVSRPDFAGKNHPNFGKKGYWYGKKNLEHSEKMKGEKNHNYGKPPLHPFLFGDMNLNYWKGKVGPNKGLLNELNWNSKKVAQYTKQGVFLASYGSIAEAERVTGVRNANIVQCCKGKLKTTGGYIWKYL
jgi:hypothetical protein